jgi:hypothetical protein
MHEIVPPVRVFIDDAGSRSFNVEGDLDGPCGSVTCAVSVPVLNEGAVFDLLPRSSKTGALLKAQSPELSPEQATTAVESILRLDGVDIAVLVVDTSSHQNLETFQQAKHASDTVRRALKERRISGPNLLYILFAAQAVALVWGVARRRREHRFAFFELILDEANLHHKEEQLLRRIVTEASAEHQIRYQQITWANEENEPLLHVPDLIAGIYHRGILYDDVRECIQILEAASRSGRIRVAQGMEVRITDADEVQQIVEEMTDG